MCLKRCKVQEQAYYDKRTIFSWYPLFSTIYQFWIIPCSRTSPSCWSDWGGSSRLDVVRDLSIWRNFNSQVLEFLLSLGNGLVFSLFPLFSHPELFISPAIGVRRRVFQIVIPIILYRSVSNDQFYRCLNLSVHCQFKKQSFPMQVFLLLVLSSALGNSSKITPRLLFSGLALVQVLCRVENHSCGRAGILLLVYILRTVIPSRCCRRMTRTTYFFSLTVKG